MAVPENIESANASNATQHVASLTCPNAGYSGCPPEEIANAAVERGRKRGGGGSGENVHLMVTKLKAGIVKPKVFMATREPDSVEAALQNLEWKQAMTDEFLALIRNNTWSLVEVRI